MGSDAEEVYIALIGDIRGSREIPGAQRDEIQRELEACLARAPDELDPRLEEALLEGPGTMESELSEQTVAEPVITTGDEFQGLFRSPYVAISVMSTLSERLAELEWAFGIGAGTLTTALKHQAVGMDGPCFHHARAALEAAKNGDRWARTEGFGGAADRWANATLALVGAIRSDLTPKQIQYARAARTAGTQREVAERFGVSPSVVSESLQAGHIHELREAETTLADMIFLSLASEKGPWWRP